MLSSETLTSFLSTFFGAFLALGLTYIYDRRQTHRLEQDDTRKVLTTIRYEMNVILQRIENAKHAQERFQESIRYVNLEDLEDTTERKPKRFCIPGITDVRLPRTSFDAAIYSGKFFLLDQAAFDIVTRTYGLIDEVNRASNEVLVSHDMESRSADLDDLMATVHAGLHNLSESLHAAIRILEERMKS